MKLSLPVSHGLTFDSRDEIQEYLATQGLETASGRRRQGLMGQVGPHSLRCRRQVVPARGDGGPGAALAIWPSGLSNIQRIKGLSSRVGSNRRFLTTNPFGN